MARFARASDARAVSAISSRDAKWSAGSSRNAAEGLGEAVGTEEPSPERHELSVDPLDLLQADGMHLRRIHVERRVRTRQEPICLIAARK